MTAVDQVGDVRHELGVFLNRQYFLIALIKGDDNELGSIASRQINKLFAVCNVSGAMAHRLS
jgi:hypothetical protein